MRRAVLPTTFTILIGVLPACESENGSSNNNDNDSDTGAEQDTYPDLEGELEIFSYWDAPGEADAFIALLDLYSSRYPNVAVTLEREYRVIDEGLAAGEGPPDLYQDGAVYAPKDWIGSDHPLVPLDDLWEEEGWNDVYPPEIIDHFIEQDGHKYSVPVGMHRLNSLIYNTWLVPEPPETLDEFLVIAEELQARGIVPLVIGTESWVFDVLIHAVLAGLTDGDWYARYHEGEMDLSDPDEVAPLRTALEGYVEMMQYASPPPEDPSVGEDVWRSAVQMMAEKEAAMMLHGDWAKAYLTSLGYTPGLDFMSVPSLGSDDVFRYIVDGFYMFEEGENRENATHFLKLLGSAEGQAAFCPTKGASPVHPAVDRTADTWDAVAEATMTHFENAEYRLFNSNAAYLAEIGSGLYSGDMTVDEALTAMGATL